MKAGQRPRFCAYFLALVLSLLAARTTVSAGPLDKAQCDALSAETKGLLALNIDKYLDKGPEWALSHLSADDLNHVRRFIEVDEQYKFRCLPPAALVKLEQLEEDEASGPVPVTADPANGNKAASQKGKHVQQARAKPSTKPGSGEARKIAPPATQASGKKKEGAAIAGAKANAEAKAR